MNLSDRFQCTRVTPLSDVVSTDTESSDTATKSADLCGHCWSFSWTQVRQSMSVHSVRQGHHQATEQTPKTSAKWACNHHTSVRTFCIVNIAVMSPCLYAYSASKSAVTIVTTEQNCCTSSCRYIVRCSTADCCRISTSSGVSTSAAFIIEY